MRISEAVSKARPIEVEFDGGAVLNVEYRPMSYTPNQLDEMQAKAKEAKDPKAGVASLLDSMMKLLVSWDLTDDKGKAIPITHDGLRNVPLNVFTEVMSQISVDQQAGEASPSADG